MRYKSINDMARDLGVGRTTIWRWLRKLGIETVPDAYDARVRLIRPEDQVRVRNAIRRNERTPKKM